MIHKQQRAQHWILGVNIAILVFVFIIWVTGEYLNAFRNTSNDYVVAGIIALPFLAILLSIACGIFSYSSNEKYGTHCVLYHHAVSLHRIFWSKYVYGLFIVFFCALFFIIVAVMFINFQTVQNPPFYTITDKFIAVFTAFLLGFLPYCCSMLACHLGQNKIYAFLESIVFSGLAIALFWHLEYGFTGSGLITHELLPFGYINIAEQLSYLSLPWPLLYLLGAFSLAAWRTATDRRVLTEGALYRHGYIFRLVVFIAALGYALFYTGWKDLLYLLTGIDIGIG
jgi:ABC-type transport system involved in multi-copper enzyme maturation permease subunit